MAQPVKKHRRRKKRPFLSFLAFLLLAVCAATFLLFIAFPMPYDEEVAAACDTYGVSPSLAYAVIRIESNFDTDAISAAGAMGLMQITPETYQWSLSRQGKSVDADTENLFDATENITTGIHVLSLLYEQFEDTDTVLAAYNAGIGNVEKWLNDRRYTSNGKTLDEIPYGETSRYVKKVKYTQIIYQSLYHLD